MKDEIEKAITSLTKKAEKSLIAVEALQLTQAALNLAHVRATLVGADKLEKS